MFDYTYECPRPEIIRAMMESGRFQWSEGYAALALSNAAKRGNVDLLQDIFQLNSPLRENHTLWKRIWPDALKNSCSHGNLGALQWLMGHSSVRDLPKEMKQHPLHSVRSKLFETAVEGGHVEVMQYLFDEGILCPYERITRVAVQEDKLDALKWLAKHIWIDHPEHFKAATYDAACYGRLEMLKFLHALEHSQQYEVTGNKRRLISGPTFSWPPDVVIGAARGGHVAVLKWLQENRSAKSDFNAMDSAASKGHLDTMKWLHANRSEGCSTDAMRWSIENGDFEMVKWLYENCPESRFPHTVVRAIRYGHFRMACWLRKKYPDYIATETSATHKRFVGGVWQHRNVLEAILYLHVFYRDVFTPRVLGGIREDYTKGYDRDAHTTELVLGWLDDNYPSTAEISV